ncbi:MAG: DUF5665 domain-containing protein [Candidatus Berkelbacteria bacterium]
MQEYNQKTLEDKLDRHHKLMHQNIKTMAWYRVFGRGVIAGLGASIGAAIVISGLIYILNHLEFVPFMNQFVEKTKIILEHARR